MTHQQTDPGPNGSEEVRLTNDEQEFRTTLLTAAHRLDRPHPELMDRLLAVARVGRRGLAHRLLSGGWPRARLLAAAAFGLAACGLLALRWAERPVPLGPEQLAMQEAGTRKAAAETGERDPAALLGVRQRDAEPPVQPAACATRFRAGGQQPLIDDFEDGDSMALVAEGRTRPWLLHFDLDPEGEVLRVLSPQLRPTAAARAAREPSAEREAREPSLPETADLSNRWALRLGGPKLHDWGAVADLSFEPHLCYDASRYRGLQFWAKGPGRVHVGVRELRVIPTRWGGGCDGSRKCYDAHAREITLGAEWQFVRVLWSELAQKAKGSPALDATSLHSLQFEVRAEDTPFDLWIDDVAFVP